MISKIVLPQKPSEESLRLLLKARLMLGHAKEHAAQKTDFDNMIAVLGFDNTVEYILRITATHLDLEGVTGKSFSQVELATLAAEINKTLNELSGITLPYLAEIKLLRNTRNLVQHGAVAPNAELDRFGSIADRFMSQILSKIFGINDRELRISSVIKNDEVRSSLTKAEEHLENKKWLEVVIASRNAFESACHEQLKNARISLALYPGIVHSKERNYMEGSALEAIKNDLEKAYLGINNSDYRHFDNYLNHVPLEYKKNTGSSIVMNRNWEKRDAEFCYNFAANSILRWQSQEKENFSLIEMDRVYTHEESYGDIPFTEGALFDGGCRYFLGGNSQLHLFYTDRKTRDSFCALKRMGQFFYRSKTYADGKLENSYENNTYLQGIHTYLATHDPERWGVAIWFEELDPPPKN